MKAGRLALAGGVLGIALAQIPAYHEPFRPQFHFSPKIDWTNDPNGPVYFNGVYHLFFQYNPFGDTWGHMSWGHATSRDLVHWTEQKVALPEENGVMIFTGSVVVDAKNSSGFCTGGKPCLVAVYTGHTMKTASKPALQTQNLAYSNDGGYNWTKYERNPVLDLHLSDFRDPKAFWSAASGQWIMAVSLPNDHKVRIYGSPDLKKWTPLSEFGPAGATAGQWECPELFEAPIEGRPGQTRWVLKIGLNPGGLQGGSGEQYFIGKFDGRQFVNDNPPALSLWTDYGKDCYCALAFNNLPPNQAPVIIGWMNNWQYAAVVPSAPWRGQMTLPRVVSLKQYSEGLRLVQRPAPALAQLRQGKDSSGQTLELLATATIGSATEVGWKLLSGGGSFTTAGYDANSHQVFVDRTRSGQTGFSDRFPARVTAPYQPGLQLKLHIFLDQSSIEVFVGDGEVTLTNLVFPPKEGIHVEPYTMGGPPGKMDIEAYRLRSIW